MTQLQREILTFLAACTQPQTASWIIDKTSLRDRRHTANPNGNRGGGDWRRKSMGSVLTGMRKRGLVEVVLEWPKTWEITTYGRDAIRGETHE